MLAAKLGAKMDSLFLPVGLFHSQQHAGLAQRTSKNGSATLRRKHSRFAI
jgi:hypothetical protein